MALRLNLTALFIYIIKKKSRFGNVKKSIGIIKKRIIYSSSY